MKKYTVILLYRKEFTEVLLQLKKRGPESNIGKWNGVGGKLEAGESIKDGALREVFEEAGVSLSDFDKFERLRTDVLPCGSLGRTHSVCLNVFYGLLKDGVNVTQREDETLKWFKSSTLHKQYNTIAGSGDIVCWNNMVVTHYLKNPSGDTV